MHAQPVILRIRQEAHEMDKREISYLQFETPYRNKMPYDAM